MFHNNIHIFHIRYSQSYTLFITFKLTFVFFKQKYIFLLDSYFIFESKNVSFLTLNTSMEALSINVNLYQVISYSQSVDMQTQFQIHNLHIVCPNVQLAQNYS